MGTWMDERKEGDSVDRMWCGKSNEVGEEKKGKRSARRKRSPKPPLRQILHFSFRPKSYFFTSLEVI